MTTFLDGPELCPVTSYLKALAHARMTASANSTASMSPDMERWLLEHGEHWHWADRPLPAGVRYGAMTKCYGNAQAWALADDGLRYVEGWATCDGHMACSHAWCVDAITQVVVDPTWRRELKDRRYFGVAFATAFVHWFQNRQGRPNQDILGWSAGGWPIQSGNFARAFWQADFQP
jgi:hypothetical protein